MSDYWNNRKVLVTGCSGFLGAWLVRKLLERGADCVGFDLDPSGCLAVHHIAGEFPVAQGSVLDFDCVKRALGDHTPEVCIHLAGQAMIEGAGANPLAAWEVNVQGTWIVMEACRQSESVAQIATASSNHTYGPQAARPFPEESPFNQLDAYGASKACADLITRTYAFTVGVPAVAVRNTNTFGSGDPHSSHLVTGTVLSILRGERPVIRSDGRPTKAYLYVEDTVEAYMLLAEHAARPDVRAQAFNVTPAEPISVLELVRTVLRVAGSDLEPEILGGRSNEPVEFIEHLSGAKLRDTLSWEPRFSLEEGIRRTLDWYTEHGDVRLASSAR